MFPHTPCKQGLSDGVVDLMRACMQKVFALQINLCTTRVCSQPLRVKQWSGSAGVIAQQHVEFASKIRVVSNPHELSGQLFEWGDQCFRNIAATELAPMAEFVRFASTDGQSLHRIVVLVSTRMRRQPALCRLSPSRSGEDEGEGFANAWQPVRASA